MPRRSSFVLGLALCGLLCGCAAVQTGSGVVSKKLIEFGWDEPDTAFMRQHSAEMDQSPFDGCVFHITYSRPDGTTEQFTWKAWSRRAFSETDFQPALADLAATRFQRLTHNFLRFNTTPGDVDWFDDFAAILNNARLAAHIARQGGAEGLLFDSEQYEGPLFNYRKQRDAATRSWEEYAAQVRRRGREVMEAFQQGYPDLTVFLTFGYSAPWRESANGAKPLADCDYGLLVPFLDGMLEAASGSTRLVDGYELAYWHNKDIGTFASAYKVIRETLLPIVADPAAYRRRLSVGFGLWMDFDSTARGWDPVDGSRNYYTPEEFEVSVRKALEVADEYVWIFTQAPRWWSPEGKPVKLPQGYAEALRRARRQAVP